MPKSYDPSSESVNTTPPSEPALRPRKPRLLRDHLTDLRILSVESESLSEQLADILGSLPTSSIRETTQALANVAEEKARKLRERIDELIAEAER